MPDATATSAKTTPPSVSVAQPLDHSNWKRRWVFTWLASIAVLVLEIVSLVKGNAPNGYESLFMTLFILIIVAPSAEQAIKMLSTVAALRAGVTFTSRSEVDAQAGTASTETTATPAATPPAEAPTPAPRRSAKDRIAPE